jgi:hypothetical protein
MHVEVVRIGINMNSSPNIKVMETSRLRWAVQVARLNLVRKPEGCADHLRYIVVDGRITLNCTLNKQDMWVWTRF